MSLTWDVLVGDAREVLRTLPARSVHMVFTSPPYYLMRDYGIPESEWADGWVGCLGWEPSPKMFVDHLREVLREVWRVLRDDGTCWINIGDKYAEKAYKPWGVKPGDEYGVPDEMVRGLMRDGWYRRATVVWNKQSFRPEGATCRPHKSHEFVYMLTKVQSGYYYDAEAVRQPHSEGTVRRWGSSEKVHEGCQAFGSENHQDATGAVASGNMGERRRSRQMDPRGAHLRTVWDLPNAKYTGNHLATFPPELPERGVLAGTSPQACPVCGAPWGRVIELGEPDEEWKRACGADAKGEYHGTSKKDWSGGNQISGSELKARILSRMRKRTTVGWEPRCECPDNDGSGHCVVLDPFAGTFTTGVMARQHGRSAIGIEISEEYAEQARQNVMLNIRDIMSFEDPPSTEVDV